MRHPAAQRPWQSLVQPGEELRMSVMIAKLATFRRELGKLQLSWPDPSGKGVVACVG
jgi:hypothetical protein